MHGSLPPLNNLRFFEAAARHLSFTRAARELHVTQAAVSHQVKQLEQQLGVRLFRRLTRRLLLTDEGQTLLPVVQDCFERLADTTRVLQQPNDDGPLVIMLRPFFAARWLAPRLSKFWHLHPDIDLRLHHSSEPRNYDQDRFDLAVRWGQGNWPDVESELLLKITITPVCSPKLLRGKKPLRTIDDLRHVKLLHEENYGTWRKWLKAAGASHINHRRGSIIDDTNIRIQAAIDAQGVAFGPVALLQDDLATQRLVAPFELTMDDLAYYIIYPPGALQKPKVKTFRDWLLAEAAT